MKIGHYKTLDVEHDATPDQIKKAFYKLAHIHHHPDKGGQAESFKALNEAYQVLKDENSRLQYDIQIGKYRPGKMVIHVYHRQWGGTSTGAATAGGIWYY